MTPLNANATSIWQMTRFVFCATLVVMRQKLAECHCTEDAEATKVVGMKSFPQSLLYLLLLSAGATTAAAADFESFLTGNATDVKPAKTEGALMLMGGGGLVDEAYRWFIQKAGGGDIVVLKASDGKTAAVDTYGAYLHGTIGGCDSVELISFYNREAANNPKVLEALKNAEGIFMGGGAQHRYVDYWKGTAVGAALEAHVRAGRPLGGSSAGLAVMGQVCYTAQLTARLTSEIAMKNPFDKVITFENDFLHLDLMRGVITDTHFSTRGRLGRLITFVARSQTIGIGVDEKTALCVEADGMGRVMSTAPEGRAWLIMPQQAPEALKEGQPLTYRDVKVIGAGPESVVNLPKRVIEKPVATSTVSIIAGQLTSKSE
jgi:cyanophycinase